MPKKIEEKPEEIEENEVEESHEELEEEIAEKKSKIKKKAVAAGANSSQVQNIIGEVKPPENPENKEDVLSYFKKLDEKIDRLLKSKEAESTEEEDDDEDDQSEKKAKRRHSNGKGVKGERRDHFGFKY